MKPLNKNQRVLGMGLLLALAVSTSWNPFARIDSIEQSSMTSAATPKVVKTEVKESGYTNLWNWLSNKETKTTTTTTTEGINASESSVVVAEAPAPAATTTPAPAPVANAAAPSVPATAQTSTPAPAGTGTVVVEQLPTTVIHKFQAKDKAGKNIEVHMVRENGELKIYKSGEDRFRPLPKQGSGPEVYCYNCNNAEELPVVLKDQKNLTDNKEMIAKMLLSFDIVVAGQKAEAQPAATAVATDDGEYKEPTINDCSGKKEEALAECYIKTFERMRKEARFCEIDKKASNTDKEKIISECKGKIEREFAKAAGEMHKIVQGLAEKGKGSLAITLGKQLAAAGKAVAEMTRGNKQKIDAKLADKDVAFLEDGIEKLVTSAEDAKPRLAEAKELKTNYERTYLQTAEVCLEARARMASLDRRGGGGRGGMWDRMGSRASFSRGDDLFGAMFTGFSDPRTAIIESMNRCETNMRDLYAIEEKRSRFAESLHNDFMTGKYAEQARELSRFTSSHSGVFNYDDVELFSRPLKELNRITESIQLDAQRAAMTKVAAYQRIAGMNGMSGNNNGWGNRRGMGMRDPLLGMDMYDRYSPFSRRSSFYDDDFDYDMIMRSRYGRNGYDNGYSGNNGWGNRSMGRWGNSMNGSWGPGYMTNYGPSYSPGYNSFATRQPYWM